MIGQEEINLVQGLIPFLSEHPVIFDCGSNKGDWSDIILKEVLCDLYLFEPNKMLLDYTRIKYEYKKNIAYNEMAVAHFNGQAEFYYFENFNNELSSLYKQGWWEGELPMRQKKIHACKIDTYCKLHSIEYIDYLKLDLEGGEPAALEGCKEMLANGKIRIIQIEYGGHYTVSNKKFADVIEWVNALGYSVYSYDEKTNNYNTVPRETFQEDYHYENYIITKEEIHNFSVGGWINPFIESTKDLPKFDFMMEVGSAEGLTAKYMCENMLEEGGRMIVVDPLNDYYIKEEDQKDYPYFKQQYQRWKRNTRGLPIELFREDSRSVLPKFHAFRFGFIYLDGNHTGEVVYIDSKNSFPILKKGGYLLWDDYDIWSEDTKAGIDKFLSEYEGQYEIIKNSYQLLIRKL